MKYYAYDDNTFTIRGRVARMSTFANGKAANITVAVKSGKENSDTDNFITVRSFQPKVFKYLKTGMGIVVSGYIGTAEYVDKNGEKKYKDNNDLIANAISYNESLSTIKTREIEKAYM